MLSPRWTKVVRDLWVNKTRTLLVIVATTLSIFAVSAVLTALAILTREIRVNYERTQPASATFVVDRVDQELLSLVRQQPDIAEAEARQTVRARVRTGDGEWEQMLLFVVADFADMRLNTFTVERSQDTTPANNDMWIERSTGQFLTSQVGDMLTVEMPDGTQHSVTVSGIVYDPGQSPSWMDAVAYGYITPSGLRALNGEPALNALRVMFADASADARVIEAQSQSFAAWLNLQGQTVRQIEIPPPGAHPHQAQMNALLVLLLIFSLLALLLSAILVSTMISAFLSQQTRQIGIMKTLGARTRQITTLYLSQVLALTAVALVIGMIAGTFAGRAGAAVAGGLLNFDITSTAVPIWVYVLQAALGLSIPTVVAFIPVIRSSRITVLEAINDPGISASAFGSGDFDGLLMRVQRLSRPTLLSIRNTFRKTGRLILTLSTLAVSGAIFIAALNVLTSWNSTLDAAFEGRRYDMEVRLQRSTPREDIVQGLETVPGITAIETWNYANAARAHEGEIDVVRAYPGGIHGGFLLVGLPENTTLLSLGLVAGRWLQSDDVNAVVINRTLLKDEPDLQVGQDVSLRLNGQAQTWRIVGIVNEIGFPATAYTTLAAFDRAAATPSMTNNLRITVDTNDAETISRVATQIEGRLSDAGIQIASLLKTTELRTAFDEHIAILLSALFIIALLTALVGGLGLTSTMSMNVLERTREFGVMRTMGARSKAVLSIVLIEGLVISVLSWIVSLALSLPLTLLVGQIAGQVGLGTALSLSFAPLAIIAWLSIAVVLGALASSLPASNALRLTVQRVLAYQ